MRAHSVYHHCFKSEVMWGNVFTQDVNYHGFRWRLDVQWGSLFSKRPNSAGTSSRRNPACRGEFKAGACFQTGEYADVLVDSPASEKLAYYFMEPQELEKELLSQRRRLAEWMGQPLKSARRSARVSGDGL